MPGDAERHTLSPVPTELTTARATTPQEYFWGLALDDADPHAYYSQASFVLHGDLDADALRRSASTLVAAHGIYRTALREDHDELRQIVLPSSQAPAFELEIVDRGHIDETSWQAEIERSIRETVANGFDLATGRVVRARLTRLAPNKHLLTTAFHHVAAEAESKGVFFRRLFELYSAARAGEPLIERPPLQFIDVADAFVRFAETPTGQARAAYWRERVHGAPDVLVPNDLPREPVDARRASLRHGITADLMHPAEYVKLAPDVREAVTRFARDCHVTIHSVFLAGLVWLLHRETGQRDLCVEATATTRTEHPALKQVHGGLTSWTVLRVDLNDCITFRDAVISTGRTIAEAKRNGTPQDYYRLVPFPLRRVVFNYVATRWAPRPAQEYAGMKVVRHPQPFARWKRPWDMHLTILDGDDAQLTWTGNEKLFRRDTISGLFARYLSLLEAEMKQG